MDGEQLTLDDELDAEETWEEWFASLPRIPGEPPPDGAEEWDAP
jgi:hypothetical protein